ncbi:MAG: hypothetical protein ABIN89_04675 [Chitinophagaceae bacterium]
MYKVIYCLMLVISITGQTHAQNERTTNSDKVFELNSNIFHRRFQIDLGKGNKMQIELNDIADLDRITNPDSLLRVFVNDILPLKDSLSDELTSKRIDYINDPAGIKKIRIQQFKPKGSSFVVNHGELAAMKVEQDTVNFNIPVSYASTRTPKNGFTGLRHYRVSFFVNQLSELNSILDIGLNDKVRLLRENVNGPWVNNRGNRVNLKVDSSISAKQSKGFFSSPGFHYSLYLSTNIQNYKNYFVPSVNLGSTFIISNSFFKREIGIFWEPNFFFSKNNQGNLQTFRNDFITVTFGQGSVQDNNPLKESYLLTILSYSYLVGRKGDYFDNHTSRLGAGRLSLFDGKMRIEPAIYFNNFFKGVTPAVRLMQRF